MARAPTGAAGGLESGRLLHSGDAAEWVGHWNINFFIVEVSFEKHRAPLHAKPLGRDRSEGGRGLSEGSELLGQGRSHIDLRLTTQSVFL